MLRGLVRKKLMNNIQSMRGHCEAPPLNKMNKRIIALKS